MMPQTQTSARLPLARILALAACLALPVSARADETADRHAAAVDVLHELRSVEMVSGIVPSLLAQVRHNVTRDDPDLGKDFDAYAPKLKAQAEAAQPDLLTKLADVYATTFTLDELKQMLVFYKSPVGQRIIETEGPVNQGMLAAAREWGTTLAKAMAADATAELQGTKPATSPN